MLHGNLPPMDPTAEPTRSSRPGLALLPLAVALVLMFALSVYPPLVIGRNGQADHLALGLLCWSMAAGFTRGVGLIPQRRIPRLLLSAWACLLPLALAILRLASGWS